MRIGRTYYFEAAHSLPKVPEGHKCARLHGHNWRLDVVVLGACDERGWLMDFADLDAIVSREVLRSLDHRHLNEIDGLANPTSENVLTWIVPRLRAALVGSCELVVARVWENDRCFAEWGSGRP